MVIHCILLRVWIRPDLFNNASRSDPWRQNFHLYSVVVLPLTLDGGGLNYTSKMSIPTKCLLFCRSSLRVKVKTQSTFTTKATAKMSAVMTGYGNSKLISGNGVPLGVSILDYFYPRFYGSIVPSWFHYHAGLAVANTMGDDICSWVRLCCQFRIKMPIAQNLMIYM